jgi:outer membrane scaffolding protein for murein synthesis (MipA/OmpV family)
VIRQVVTATVLGLLLAGPTAAQEVRLPLLEAGIFGGGGVLPDYPAADSAEPRALALPWLIYRGESIRSDERGLRGRIYRATRLEVTLNVNGALASNASGSAREGMPDLEYLGEIGPSLRWVPWQDEARRTRLTLELPLRAAFSTDLARVRHRGFVFAPEAAVEHYGALTPQGRLRIGLGPVFASGGLMDYWYRVKPGEARPDRPAYDAEGGYLGLRLQFSYRTPLTERVSLTAGGRVENFSGATNEASPLFRSDFNLTLVAGLSVTLYRTEATVASTAEPFD